MDCILRVYQCMNLCEIYFLRGRLNGCLALTSEPKDSSADMLLSDGDSGWDTISGVQSYTFVNELHKKY